MDPAPLFDKSPELLKSSFLAPGWIWDFNDSGAASLRGSMGLAAAAGVDSQALPTSLSILDRGRS